MVAQAAPVMVPSLRSTATTYAFFYTNTENLLKKRINPDLFKQNIEAQLPPGISACWTQIDQNATNINCGNLATGQMQLGGNELFSYVFEILLPKDPIIVQKDGNLKQVFIANAISAGGNVPADVTGRASRIHFTTRVAQFGMLVDPNSATTIQFIINNQALPPQQLTPGVAQYFGVEDKHGFNDITIIAGGALGQSFVADRIGFLPLSKF